MCGLQFLKHVCNLSDESVVEQWSENAYYQYFCGMLEFTPSFPCNASELVHFRKRIGEKGMELILSESIRVNQEGDGRDHHGTAFIDSTVQEKNVTYPTDAKLHKKIVRKVLSIVKTQGIPLRQSYTFVLKRIYRDQASATHPKNRGKALKADRRLRTIAEKLVRELKMNIRNLPMHCQCAAKVRPPLPRPRMRISQSKAARFALRYCLFQPPMRPV